MNFSYACKGPSVQETDMTTTSQDQHNRHHSRNNGLAQMLMIPPSLFCPAEDSPARLQRKRREAIEHEEQQLRRYEAPTTSTTPPSPPTPSRVVDIAEEAIAILRGSNRNNDRPTRNGSGPSNFTLQQWLFGSNRCLVRRNVHEKFHLWVQYYVGSVCLK